MVGENAYAGTAPPVAALRTAKLKVFSLSLGHWNEAILVVKTVLLTTKPPRGADPSGGPSIPIDALKEL